MRERVQRAWWAVKQCMWPRGIEAVNFWIFFAWFNYMAWIDKDRYLKGKDRIELLLRALSALSVIIGVVLVFGHSSESSSYFERAVDSRLHYQFLGVYLHRWFGVAMVASGLLSFVAVMEWPTSAEQDQPSFGDFNANRLRVLTNMQMTGMMTAGCYWFISFMVTVFPLNDPLRMPPLTSLFFAYVHYEMCVVINRLYVRSKYRSARASKKKTALRIPESELGTVST